jgi:hypothetical protein
MRIAPALGVLLIACVAGAFALAVRQAGPEQGALVLKTPGPEVSLSTTGSVVRGQGASAHILSRLKPGAYANVVAEVDVDDVRGARLEVSAELGPTTAQDQRIWVWVDSVGTPLIVQDLPKSALAKTGHVDRHSDIRRLVVPIPSGASNVRIGLSLVGPGESQASRIRATVLESLDAAAPPSDSARRELDSAIAIVRAHALRSGKVDWNRVVPGVRRLAMGTVSPLEVGPAIQVLLAALADRHSLYQSAETYRQYQAGEASISPPVGGVAAAGVAALEVSPLMSASAPQMREYANGMHQLMRRLKPDASCGWIVDLREDTGGNVTAMVAALQPLLGPAPVLQFTRPVPAATQDSVVEGPFSAIDYLTDLDMEAPRDLAELEEEPVAVLLGPSTASAGEAVAMAFRGRPDTRFFGAPSAGLATANAYFGLPSGAAIGLTTSYMSDRAGERYEGSVPVDEPTSGLTAAGTDSTRWAAVTWLRGERVASGRRTAGHRACRARNDHQTAGV